MSAAVRHLTKELHSASTGSATNCSWGGRGVARPGASNSPVGAAARR
uniref:Uncharacterized protein n=1 Tax=Arundo donax TaxID=35708 RepID=A0A0A8ZB50_ARUDO